MDQLTPVTHSHAYTNARKLDMIDQSRHVAAGPVFKQCPRCQYSLRGLPVNHACPECGLRFDDRCELYRLTNAKQVLAVWIVIFVGGFAVLQNLPDLFNFAAVSTWDKVGALAAVAWFFLVGFSIWFLFKRFRRGFEVAVTADGLIVRLPGFADELVPWDDIDSASIKEQPEGRPQIAGVLLKRSHKILTIGGVANVFPTQVDVARFVRQVMERVGSTIDVTPDGPSGASVDG